MGWNKAQRNSLSPTGTSKTPVPPRVSGQTEWRWRNIPHAPDQLLSPDLLTRLHGLTAHTALLLHPGGDAIQQLHPTTTAARHPYLCRFSIHSDKGTEEAVVEES